VAKPIPLLPPVITATLPSSFPMITPSLDSFSFGSVVLALSVRRII